MLEDPGEVVTVIHSFPSRWCCRFAVSFPSKLVHVQEVYMLANGCMDCCIHARACVHMDANIANCAGKFAVTVMLALLNAIQAISLL